MIPTATSSTKATPHARVFQAAEVKILSTNVKVTTGPNGRFRILRIPAGSYSLDLRHLGYAPTSTALRVVEGDTLRMSFALARLANPLDTVVVEGKRLSPRMVEFEDRRKFGFGQFMTREQIEARNKSFTADLVRTFQSVKVVSPRAFQQVAVNIRGGCAFTVFVDGVRLHPPVNLDDLPLPHDLAGIEVYSGAATIPLQYKTTGGSFCGVILFWTRDGS